MTPGVIWLTGLPNSGKTTIAARVTEILLDKGMRPIHLDGDMLRSVLPPVFGHTERDRRSLSLFYGRLAHVLVGQGHLVVFSTVSLFHAVHDWNRAHIAPYVEVLVTASESHRLARDDRGVLDGDNVVGVDIVPEFPLEPHIVLANEGGDPRGLAQLVVEQFLQQAAVNA